MKRTEWSSKDSEVIRATYAPPSITMAGRTYTGRILSVEEFEPYRLRVDEVMGDKDEPEARALIALFRDYGNLIFGRRWWEVWRVNTNPTERILRLPPGQMLEHFLSFLQAQLEAMKMPRLREAERKQKQSA